MRIPRTAPLIYNKYNIEGTKSQELKKEKLKKITKKKVEQRKIIDILLKLNEDKKAKRLQECASFIELTSCQVCGVHITAANFCRERVCNICAWRRQAKYRSEFQKMLNIINPKENSLRHLTLTIKNVKEDELSEYLNKMFYAWKKLVLNTEWKKHVIGSSRTLEITYNEKEKTYHPHFHCLIEKKGNFSTAKIGEAWRKALQINYSPEVKIKKLTDEKGILECFKYAFKSTEATPELIKVFLYTLKGRRLVGFTGSFKEARQKLKLSDDIKDLTEQCIYNNKQSEAVTQEIYRFDFTGGIYKLYENK